MFNMKKALAVAMTVALMTPATAFAAGSPVLTSIAGQTATVTKQYSGKDEVLAKNSLKVKISRS